MRSAIKQAIKAIADRFDNNSTLEHTQSLMREAQQTVREFYEKQLNTNGVPLAEAAGRNPEGIHEVTERNFGFNVHEQPSYSSIDDYAWQTSQRYTTLENVDLPENARFFDSQRRSLTKAEMERHMADGDHHLFDIALSNEYVLLGREEQFSVADLERRFSTNNEHLAPQSKSRKEGGTRVFKSDPRVIIISDMDNNSKRGNLQIVFLDEKGHPRESVSLLTDEEQQVDKAMLVQNDFSVRGSGARYGVGPEDAPHYAYALALAHFGNGFSAQDDRSWFDRLQAEEVAKMLTKLAEKPVDANKEPVMRDILTDAKILDGTINPVALLPEAFANALHAEIDKGKFRGREAQAEAPASPPTSHVEALKQRQSSAAAQIGR